MRNEEISSLIKKFYDGYSTEEDEKYLRAIFSGNKPPEGFEAEKEFILFCMSGGPIKGPSPDLEERILSKVDKSGRIALNSKSGRNLITFISSAAAVFILLTGAYFFLESRNSYRDTFSDPDLAYAETMKILMDVSERLNKGTSALEPVGKLSTVTGMSIEKINESSALINKSMSQLKDLRVVSDDRRTDKPGVVNK